jgi:hypothetical protein
MDSACLRVLTDTGSMFPGSHAVRILSGQNSDKLRSDCGCQTRKLNIYELCPAWHQTLSTTSLNTIEFIVGRTVVFPSSAFYPFILHSLCWAHFTVYNLFARSPLLIINLSKALVATHDHNDATNHICIGALERSA